ncbi:MAG: DUF401 family protein [Chloroflexota bacterium]
MLSPTIALLISIALIILLVRIRAHPGLAIFVGAVVMSVMVVPLDSIPSLMWSSIWSLQTLKLMIIVASALTLSGVMEQEGLMAKLAGEMESVGPRVALHFIPAAIGLVPMPAGALVSATASRGLVERLGLTPEQGTFINYWFRHIWEFSLPIYPTVVITGAILSVSFLSLLKVLFPATVLVTVLGAVMSYWVLRKVTTTGGKLTKSVVGNLFRAAWPILVLVPAVLLGLDAAIAFPLVVGALALQRRLKWTSLKSPLKYGLNVKILLLLYAIMFYKAVIQGSDTTEAIISGMQTAGLPALFLLIAPPFLIGLAMGLGMAFAGVVMPLLMPYLMSGGSVDGPALLLAYVSGMMGVLLSPVHLCLILSADYFKANLAEVYVYILPLFVAIEGIAAGIYCLAA